MHHCEFCGTGIAETDGAVIPGPAMTAALDRGYVPTMCPVESLRNPQKNWRLCNTCFTPLGDYLPPPPRDGNTNEALEGLQYILPTNTTILSILASYAGLFAVLVFPAPIALLLGIIALLDVRKKKRLGQKIGGAGRAIFAIVMGGLFTIPLIMFLLNVLSAG